jgi:NitT/TauT family transport system substrate-binding protein
MKAISLKLQLDWKPNAQFAGVVIAHHLGWYERAGIALELLPWQPYNNPMDALDGLGNMLCSTEDNLHLMACAQGKPVKAIAAMMQYSGIGWMSLKSSNIHGIPQLAGKRVGVHGDGITALKIALHQFGVHQGDVAIVEAGYNWGELLASGEFDAIQCYVMAEPIYLAQQGFELNVIRAYEWGYQVYAQVIATTERLIAAEPDALARFLKITFDGWRQALTNPAKAAQVIALHYLPETNATAEEEMLIASSAILEGDVGLSKLGWMTHERWAKSIGYLTSHRLIAQPLRSEDVMTSALLSESKS